MSEIYFLVMPALKDTVGWSWTAIGVCVSICASIIALIGLITTRKKILHDAKYQRSMFYLEQIKSYFSNAVLFLSDCKNNNVKWHQAIEALKITDELKKYLIDASHKHIYVIEYMNTAFSIVDIIKDIHDFKFFYGVPDFKNKSSAELFEQASPLALDKPHFRVSPEALRSLCVFIDKANKVFNDLCSNKNKNEIFESKYFEVDLTDHKSVCDISKSTTLKVIYGYLKDFENQENDRLKMRTESVCS